MKVLIILHRGKTPACVKVRQVALEGSAPWPDLPITPRSSLGIKFLYSFSNLRKTRFGLMRNVYQGGQGERTHW